MTVTKLKGFPNRSLFSKSSDLAQTYVVLNCDILIGALLLERTED